MIEIYNLVEKKLNKKTQFTFLILKKKKQKVPDDGQLEKSPFDYVIIN